MKNVDKTENILDKIWKFIERYRMFVFENNLFI